MPPFRTRKSDDLSNSTFKKGSALIFSFVIRDVSSVSLSSDIKIKQQCLSELYDVEFIMCGDGDFPLAYIHYLLPHTRECDRKFKLVATLSHIKRGSPYLS